MYVFPTYKEEPENSVQYADTGRFNEREPLMASGKCALTLKEGSFVESHIIPRALTQTTNKGTGFVQVGGDAKGKKRWSSWYDNKLCTAEGEKILSDLDDWAIKFLRSNRMVWSGWGPVQQLDDHIITGPYGVRSVEVAEPDRLRLFMISLLWRARFPPRNAMLCAPICVGRAAVLVDWRIGVLEDDRYAIAGILRGYWMRTTGFALRSAIGSSAR